MTMTSVRYDFGQCTVEHVNRTADGIVIRLAQADQQDEAIFTLDRVALQGLFDRIAELNLPDVLIWAQLTGQKLGV